MTVTGVQYDSSCNPTIEARLFFDVEPSALNVQAVKAELATDALCAMLTGTKVRTQKGLGFLRRVSYAYWDRQGLPVATIDFTAADCAR